jgi:hypothetical protein
VAVAVVKVLVTKMDRHKNEIHGKSSFGNWNEDVVEGHLKVVDYV